jgi:hypothetical protein
MSLRQLTRFSPITPHRRIGPALCAVLLAGIAACAKGQDAQAAASSGAYSDSLAGVPATRREGASPVSVRLSEWKLDLSRLTVPTGEVEFTVTNGGTMLHAFEVAEVLDRNRTARCEQHESPRSAAPTRRRRGLEIALD